MKRKNTLWSLVLALVMVLGVFAPLSALASDAKPEDKGVPGFSEKNPKNITVNVHKILMSKDALDKHDKNKKYDPTKKMDETKIKSFFGDSAKEIDGVYFVALKEGHANYTNFESLTKDQQKTVVDAIKASDKENGLKSEGLTEGGQLALKLKSPGKYKIYEVKSMSTYVGVDEHDQMVLAEQKAVPVELDLPEHARTENGLADAIHVYPKNTDDKPTVDKFVVKDGKDVKGASFNIDEEHTWAIEAKIPTGFKDYEFFKLTDKLDTALTYKAPQTIKVFVKEDESIKLAENTDYTVDAPKGTEGGDLVVSLTKAGITKLAAAEGKILRAEFVTKINKNAVMGKDIPNGVELEYGHNPDHKGKTNVEEKKKPKVYTGGKLFQKIDSGNDKKLQGAIFTIKHQKDGTKPANDEAWKKVENMKWNAELIAANKAAIEAGKFAKNADGEKTTATTDVKAGDVIYLRSVDDVTGAFEIKGLEYSTYHPQKWDAGEGKIVEDANITIKNYYALEEIKAPKDYSLPSNNITEFEVNKTSYYGNPDTIQLGTAAGDAKATTIDNKPLTIPQTGGMGTMIFMVAGLALMGGAFIAMRKRSAEQA